MRKAFALFFLLAALLAACGGKGSFETVAPSDLKKHLDDPGVVVVDVRTPAEYLQGHVPRAVNLPLQEIEDWYKDLPTDKEIYLVCRSGHRSAQAMEFLKKHGFKGKVKSVKGGTLAWAQEGYPLSTAEEDPAKVLGKAPAHPKLTLPDLTLKRLGGGEVNLQQFKGRPVVINLWATWCPPCRAEMPLLAEAQSRYSGVTFVFVNQGEDEATIRKFLDEKGLVLEWVLLDPESKLSHLLRANGLPTTYFFDAEGNLVALHPGQLIEGLLEKYLEKLAR